MRTKLYLKKIKNNLEIKSLLTTFIAITSSLFCYKHIVNEHVSFIEIYVLSLTCGSVLRIFVMQIITTNTNELITPSYKFSNHSYKLDIIYKIFFIFLIPITLGFIFPLNIINQKLNFYLLLILITILLDNVTYIDSSRQFIKDNSKYYLYRLISTSIYSTSLIISSFILNIGFAGIFISQITSSLSTCFLYKRYPFIFVKGSENLNKHKKDFKNYVSIDGIVRSFKTYSEELFINLIPVLFNNFTNYSSFDTQSLYAATNYIRTLTVALRGILSRIEIDSIYRRKVRSNYMLLWFLFLFFIFIFNKNTGFFLIFLPGEELDFKINIFNSCLSWSIFFPLTLGYGAIHYLSFKDIFNKLIILISSFTLLLPIILLIINFNSGISNSILFASITISLSIAMNYKK